MQTPFTEWLSLLARAQTGPVTLKPAVRGQYYEFTISFPGNVTDAQLTGSVRSSPDAPTALAAFSVGTPTFADGRTSWVVSLAEGSGPNATGSLPGDIDGNGTEHFPFDFLLKLSGKAAERLFAGLLPISGQITEPT